MLPNVPEKLKVAKETRTVVINAFLVNGSSGTFCCHWLQDQDVAGKAYLAMNYWDLRFTNLEGDINWIAKVYQSKFQFPKRTLVPRKTLTDGPI